MRERGDNAGSAASDVEGLGSGRTGKKKSKSKAKRKAGNGTGDERRRAAGRSE